MLIAINGSQGCGKTTVLKEIEKAGHTVLQRKTSRDLLSDWGMTLDGVLSDPGLIVKFQDELINRMDTDYIEEAQITRSLSRRQLQEVAVFTERTTADAFVYALVYLGKNNEYSDWLNQYYTKCMRIAQQYHHVFYLRSGFFKVEYDGVRGSNKHYSRLIDIALLDVTKQMILPQRLSVIETADLQTRVETILTHTESLLYDRR